MFNAVTFTHWMQSNIMYGPLLAPQGQQQLLLSSPHQSGGTCSCQRVLGEVQSSYLPVPPERISSLRCEGEQLPPGLPQVLHGKMQVNI